MTAALPIVDPGSVAGAARSWFQLDGFTDRSRGIPPVDVRCGTGRVAELTSLLEERQLGRALLVTSPHVAADDAVLGPVREALGDRWAGQFVGPTSGKDVQTIADVAEQARDSEADVLVGLGGGATLVVVRQAAALLADGRSVEALKDEGRRTRGLVLSAGSAPQVVVVPTTLAGADLSVGGSFVLLGPDEDAGGRALVVNPQSVGPVCAVYDPALFAATPGAVLASSAFNGLHKAVETVYAPSATHLSDALAGRAVTLMTAGLMRLADDRLAALELAVSGVVLAQLKRDISVLHAAGQAVSRHVGVQQGIAHAILSPSLLALLLSRTDLRREVLAAQFRAAGAASASGDADAIVEAVTTLRDRLHLPTTLRRADGAAVDLRRCAEDLCGDPLMTRAPVGARLEPDDVLPVLEELMTP